MPQGSGSSSSPCAACKLLRRKCTKDCVFAPYFSPDEPQKFAYVHKVFGASNVSKILQDLPLHQRKDAISSIIYEANARIHDPVYGCVGAISSLQQQVVQLHKQLAMAQAEMVCLRMQQAAVSTSSNSVIKDPNSIMPSQISSSSTEVFQQQQHYKSVFSSLEQLDAIEPLWTSC